MGFIDENHDRDEDASYIEIRIDFFRGAELDEDGEPVMMLGQTQVHSHKVPSSQYVDTLLILARECVQRGMEESMFHDSVPQAVRDMATKILATQYLAQRMQSPQLAELDPISALVPDDISSISDD